MTELNNTNIFLLAATGSDISSQHPETTVDGPDRSILFTDLYKHDVDAVFVNEDNDSDGDRLESRGYLREMFCSVISESLECVICLNVPKDAVQFCSHHLGCRSCVNHFLSWSPEEEKLCPCCRKQIKLPLESNMYVK